MRRLLGILACLVVLPVIACSPAAAPPAAAPTGVLSPPIAPEPTLIPTLAATPARMLAVGNDEPAIVVPAPQPPLVLVAASELPPAGSANPQVRVIREYVHYDLAGTSLSELNARIRERGPPDEQGDRWAGRVNTHFNWRFQYARALGRCQVDSAEVDLAVTYILPRWQAPPDIPPALLGEWRRFLTALEDHEKGHEAIALQVAEQIHLSLLSLPPHPCHQIDQAAHAAAHGLLAVEAQRQAQYDQETQHGRTQGAVLGMVD